MSAFGEPLNEE